MQLILIEILVGQRRKKTGNTGVAGKCFCQRTKIRCTDTDHGIRLQFAVLIRDQLRLEIAVLFILLLKKHLLNVFFRHFCSSYSASIFFCCFSVFLLRS